MTQMSLIAGPALARRTDPETSKIAARQVEASGRAGSHRHKIFTFIQHNNDRTAGEIADGIGMIMHKVAKRITELNTANLITPGTPRICRVEGTFMRTWRAV